MANPKNRDFGQTALVAGSLRGYRAWSKLVGGSSEVLFSPVYIRPAPWGPGRNEAQCMQLMSAQTALDMACCEFCSAKAIEMLNRFPTDHRSPSSPSEDSKYCGTCGFYAFHAPSKPLAKTVYLPSLDESLIVGSIKATGFIVVGELGFRAQYAEIEALCGLGAEPAAEHYGVPWFATMDDLVRQFPVDKAYADSALGEYARWDVLLTFGTLPYQNTVRMDPDSKRIFVFGSNDVPNVELTPGISVATVSDGTLVTLTLHNGRIDVSTTPWSVE